MTEELKKEFSKLRFLDENDGLYPKWEEVKFDELLKTTPNRNYQIESSQVLDEGNIPVIDQGKSFIAGFSNESSKIFPRNNKNYIVYGDHTTVVKYIDFDFMLGGDGTKVLDLKKPENSIKFAYHSLCFNNAEPEGYKRHFSILRKKSFPIPSLPEQTKIAEFLSNLDERIEAQSKLVELLKKQKQGYSQRLFNGSLRFKKDDGTDYDDWEEKRLGSIGKFYRGNGLPKVDMIKNGKYDCVHYGELFSSSIVFTPVNKTDFNGVKFNKGTILMPSSDVTPDGLAKASVIQKDDVVVGGDTNIIVPLNENDSVFLAQMIRFYKNKIIREVVGTTVKHIYPKNLQTIKYNFPSLPEQEKIAAFLSNLDNRIDEELNKLEKLKLEKNGYMQRMLA